MADREFSWQKENPAGDPAEIARVQAEIDAKNPTKPGQYTGKPVPLNQKERRPPEVNDNRIEAIKDKPVTEKELIDFCKETLAKFKVPKKIEFCELPKTSTGKIQKFELRKKAKELN